MRMTVPTADAEVDLSRVDLFDPELYATGDPHPIWHALRRHAPAHHQRLADGREFWSVTRHADACRVLADHTEFTSQRGTLLNALGRGDPAGGQMMAATDPPRHTSMREPLARELSPHRLNQRRHLLTRAVRQALEPARDGDVWDLAVAAAGFPMSFTGALMGIPEADWPRLTRATTMAIAPDDTEFQEGDSHITLVGVHHELFDYFSSEVTRRLAEPSDDLIGFLTRMRPDGGPLRHDAIVYNCYSLLLGANVTTPHVLTALVCAFLEHPDEFRRLKADPGLIAPAVEEGLRWSSPANHFMRYARTDVTIADQRIRRGTAVAVWLGSANRDEAVFADPYRFDIGHRTERHLAFGYGPHFCVGASLARIALRMLLTEFVALVDDIEPAGPVRHLKSNFVAGISHLPIRTRRAGRPAAG